MSETVNILGLSAYYHDSAACLIQNGRVVAAAQEERFTRKKHDASFPRNAVEYCLRQADLNLSQIDHVVYYEKPLEKFDRLLETYLSLAPKGFGSFAKAMPLWLKEKVFLKKALVRDLGKIGLDKDLSSKFLFAQHHQSHAASAFYPSPFGSAAVLCMDGVGEWATSSVWRGSGNQLTPLWQINFPHSLGLLYSAFTYYLGFKVNSGEYKVMGLAPYGTPRFQQIIEEHLIDIKQDGTFRLNMKYFGFATGLRMTNAAFDQLFSAPPRKPESPLSQRDMDIAASIQAVTEKVVLRICETIRKETGERNLCLAGGVALNCVANGKILRAGIFDDIFIQPAAGDAGGALGAALACWHEYLEKPREISPLVGGEFNGSFLGPIYSRDDIFKSLAGGNYLYREFESEEALNAELAQHLDKGLVVGYFQGRLEFGPRALGGRSILGDPRNSQMQSVLNLKIKFRESFRPFAPAVLAEDVAKYFELDTPSPYMLLVAPVANSIRNHAPQSHSGLDSLKNSRSSIPAVTHLDYSARIQTVHARTNPKFYNLLKAFKAYTGCSVLVNTSFNVRGEPIVNTPSEALQCFMRTKMDVLVLENFMLLKRDQAPAADCDKWQQEFTLD